MISLRRFVLPAIAGVCLLGWSSVASANLHSRVPMVTAKRPNIPMYTAPRNIVPATSTASKNVAPVAQASHASRALPSGQNAASKSSGIPR